MTRAATIPAETDVLCEGCGYVLTGLPDDGRCPECGRPLAESHPSRRTLPAWEARGGVGAFAATTADVLFRPTHFYRTLATRADSRASLTFSQIHWAASSLLIGLAAYGHAVWFILDRPDLPLKGLGSLVLLALAAGAYAFTVAITLIAARLTHWEASYRGIRLPLPVVRRGLYYHAAHYFPVALITAATVVGFHLVLKRGALDARWLPAYLYTLSGEVVAAAAYLFKTYWIGMRNMMYASA